MASMNTIREPPVRLLFQALHQVAMEYGLRPRITSTYRSSADQARLYRAYLEGRSSYPVAPPGRSTHERGRAMDLVAEDLPWLGEVWESWGGRWGGRFKDPIHFEVTDAMLGRWFR